MSAYAIIFLVLFVAAALMAYAFYFQFSTLKATDDRRQKDAEEARASGQKAQKELDSAKEELTRRRTELTEAREKLSDLRAKQFKQKESDRKQRGNANDDLNDQLSDARRDLEDERSRLDVISREAKGMQEEISRLRDAQRRTEDALKTAQAVQARAAAAAVAAPAVEGSTPAPAAAPAPAAPARSDDELKARAELLDRQLRESRRKATEFEEEVRKARGKASTMNRQALLTKNELDLFREKLVWSEKRVVELEKLIFDNKIALPERELAPQPKPPQIAPGILARESANTGGEGVVAGGADYVPDAETATPAEATPAEATPASAAPEAPALNGHAEAPATAEAAVVSAEADKSGPVPVPPLRRPKSIVETRGADDAPKAD